MNKKLKSFLSALILSTILSSNFSVLAHSSSEQIKEKAQYLNNQNSNLEEIQDKIDELSKIITILELSIVGEQFEINKNINENKELKKSITNYENDILNLLNERENNKELYEETLKNIDSFEFSEDTEKLFLNKLNYQYTVVQEKIEDLIRKKIVKKDGLEKDYLEKENRITESKKLLSKFEEELHNNEFQLKDFQIKKDNIFLDIKNTEKVIDDILSRVNNQLNIKGEEIITYAKSFLGTPYLWGGTKPETGFDCSGFIQYVYKDFGIKLGRTTYNQIKDGTHIQKENLKPGDLVFFGSWNNPYHNGIYVGDGKFIHSPKTGDVIKISKLNVMNFLTGVRVIK
ncbi:C40 family peptidase [Oceanirhabdus sp. W0125-5]|uniref:C40 family peptidase n=1 Tax=Oceanirhabdus sp. W0125-5 TaxID=2999116 RepID=UPI0022F30F53|nr:NlpC/P60 family protein [Oceanirhabdus sp. W0125-5]WBW95012.1 NlpC/P60 family protein [Oceanirhabdus sp. W0125-5]